MEYKIPSTEKLFHHKIVLKNLSSESDNSEIIKYIYERHNNYLEDKKINVDHIRCKIKHHLIKLPKIKIIKK